MIWCNLIHPNPKNGRTLFNYKSCPFFLLVNGFRAKLGNDLTTKYHQLELFAFIKQ